MTASGPKHGAGAPSAPRPGPATPRAATPEPAPALEPEGPPPHAFVDGIPIAWRIADAYLAIAVLAYAELYAVALLNLRMFVGSFEISIALRGMMPVALAAAAPCAVVAGVFAEALRCGAGRAGRRVSALSAGLFAAAVGYGVAGGRHFEGGLRIPFAAALSITSGLAAFALAPHLARALVPRRGWAGAVFVAAATAVVAVALEITNARVLPRLYPAFHVGLGALVVLAVAVGALGWGAVDAPARRGRVVTGRLLRVALALGLFALGAATAQSAARRLVRRDNIRLIYLERAPLLAHVVELAALLAPPDPLDDAAPLAAKTSGHAVDLVGRDVVLITVDALRADHVGAYGYTRATTPNIDRLAATGVVFEAAYSPTPHTSYALTSIMTGKYMRPLVLQDLGADSETWAQHLRRYGFRTAAFYPPAVFFIDAERFASFRDRSLDFEYRKIEFAPASARVEQVKAYLDAKGGGRDAGAGSSEHRVFLWVHLFEPHEPYEAHAEYPFGDRDIDRYDAEIAAADAGVGAIVAAVRANRPGAVVIVAADHGEEFGEHGGRYHGTTVYEEQVRVPLIIDAPGLVTPHRVAAPVQLIDLLPTVLAGLDVPRPARVRGSDLGPLLAGSEQSGDQGFAFAETDGQTMLAKGPLRLVCARKIGACALYDVIHDPGEKTDVSAARPVELAAMRAELRAVEASHGRYEKQGSRSEGKGWPEALRRALAGDGDAAVEAATLLDDADVAIRRKTAESLFELGRHDAAPALRLALVRDEDDEVRRWCALALTRLGEGAPRARELLQDRDARWRRLAALALAESGDDRGADVLIAWWREAYPARDKDGTRPTPVPIPIPFERAREITAALAKVRAKAALVPLIAALDDLRLRPYLAQALAALGESAARPALAQRLEVERYQIARTALAEALVKLGGGPELRGPLVRFLGTPDPLADGLRIALDAGVLKLVGGSNDRDLARLRRFATSGVATGLVVPKGGNGTGLRAICRARSTDGRGGEVRFGLRAGPPPAKTDHDSLVPRGAPAIDTRTAVALAIPPGEAMHEVFATLPATVKVRPGSFGDFVVYATQNVDVAACAVVPLSDELPPPAPEPWIPSAEEDRGANGEGGSGGARPTSPH